jgi:hypothetical protein
MNLYGGLESSLDSLYVCLFKNASPMAENNIQEIVENVLSIE